MPLPNASADPTDAADAARILRKKSVLLPSDFAKLDKEAKKRAFTVTDETSLDAVRDMRNALAKAKADSIPYSEFVKTIGPKLDAQWGIDSPQLKTVFVNNVQQAANQAIVARLNRQRGKFPFWTLDVVKDEVTSATCSYFLTFPVVLPAGHPWWSKNAPMRHHRCRSTLRGLTAAEARKIGITKEPPDWPADEGWGGSAPLGEYKANMSDKSTPAKPSERIRGSKKNEPGSAGSVRGGIALSPAVVKSLERKTQEHNEKHGSTKGKRVTVGMLKAVWRRGAGAFSVSHRPNVSSRQQWAMGRVNAFLQLVRTGKPKNAKYTTDNDLLPVGHPRKSTKASDAGPSMLMSLRQHIVTMAARYEHIDFTVPKGAREEAKRGLEWRKEFGRGGTSVGVATARALVSATRVSAAKARHIAKYFPRHEVDKKGTGYSPGEDGFPSNGRIAWALWGGDAGRAWSNKLVAQMESADRKTMSMKDKKITADNGQGDVHIDGPMKVQKRPNKLVGKYPAKMRAKLAQVAPKKRTFKFAFARGGTRIEVRHMSDRSVFCGAVEIDKALLDDSGPVEAGPPKLVWNQLNKLGAFRGHPSGPFEITQQINAEIERNFRATQNQKIPIDFEHASEQDPTAGTIPSEGAPAQAWIHDLQNRGAAGLWGLVEFLEPARTYVKQGKYKYFSPAIRFGAKDRVTGQPIGARMTSGAFTNNPFLDGLMPLAASDRGVGTPVDITETAMNGSDYAHSMAEMAPKLRSCLFDPGTHQAGMATLAECYDAVCRLEACVDEFRETNADADLMTARHAGSDLGGALTRLRDAMQMGLGVTVPEMLALVKGMIEKAIGVHVDEEHDEENPPSSREMGNRTMADQETTLKLRDTESKLATLMSEKAVLANENQTLNTKVAGLELNLADREAKLSAAELELKTLRDNEAKRVVADESAAIEIAFATYKDTRNLTEAHKKSMLLHYRGDKADFEKLYPPVAPDQRHLQRNLSARQSPATQQIVNQWQPQGAAMPANGYGAQSQNFAQAHLELTNRLMSDKKMPLELATVEARRQLMEPAPVTT